MDGGDHAAMTGLSQALAARAVAQGELTVVGAAGHDRIGVREREAQHAPFDRPPAKQPGVGERSDRLVDRIVVGDDANLHRAVAQPSEQEREEAAVIGVGADDRDAFALDDPIERQQELQLREGEVQVRKASEPRPASDLAFDHRVDVVQPGDDRCADAAGRLDRIGAHERVDAPHAVEVAVEVAVGHEVLRLPGTHHAQRVRRAERQQPRPPRADLAAATRLAHEQHAGTTEQGHGGQRQIQRAEHDADLGAHPGWWTSMVHS
jgi:hypothetical protein